MKKIPIIVVNELEFERDLKRGGFKFLNYLAYFVSSFTFYTTIHCRPILVPIILIFILVKKNFKFNETHI